MELHDLEDVDIVMKTAREHSGMKTEHLAKKAGVSKGTISKYESGKRNSQFKKVNKIINQTDFAVKLVLIVKDNHDVNDVHYAEKFKRKDSQSDIGLCMTIGWSSVLLFSLFLIIQLKIIPMYSGILLLLIHNVYRYFKENIKRFLELICTDALIQAIIFQHVSIVLLVFAILLRSLFGVLGVGAVCAVIISLLLILKALCDDIYKKMNIKKRSAF